MEQEQAPTRKGGLVTATYRVQLTPDFGFAEAAKLVGYLRDLGVGYLYLSPILQAMRDSGHGYDVIDHSRVRAGFGGEEGLRELAAAGLPLVADIVPNHMAIPVPESDNTRLWSALRDGPACPYARWFDLKWPVALPVLGDEPYGTAIEVLRAGDDTEAAREGPVLRYHDHVFPLRPGTEHLPLPELLAAQHYRLVNWWESPGYRRFFDVSSLIGLRVEDPEVFAATHAVILSLIEDGVLHGLRVDHPDGLADPRGYLRRLRPHVPGPLWVEKILIGGERLPADWPCDGTTGYDALNMITRLFADPAGRDALIATFRRLTGVTGEYEAVRRESKEHVIDVCFRGEIDRLTSALGEPGLREAVVELLVSMPVYRAYVIPGQRPRASGRAGRAEKSTALAGRSGGGACSAAVVVATRLPVKLERRGGWGSETITLPSGRWRDLLTTGRQRREGEGQADREFTGRVPLARLLSRYPVAILEG